MKFSPIKVSGGTSSRGERRNRKSVALTPSKDTPPSEVDDLLNKIDSFEEKDKAAAAASAEKSSPKKTHTKKSPNNDNSDINALVEMLSGVEDFPSNAWRADATTPTVTVAAAPPVVVPDLPVAEAESLNKQNDLDLDDVMAFLDNLVK